MMVGFSMWRPLTAAETAAAPDGPGVFEVANLVRTLLFVGTAPRSLAASLTQYLEAPGQRPPPFGRLHFRFLPTDEPEKVQDDLLLSYRQHHRGALPPAQTSQPPPVSPTRHLKAV